MRRLVTFLGIPRRPQNDSGAVQGYALTTYCLYDEAGKPTDRRCQTPWIALALADFFEPREVHVLATEQAWNNRPPGANCSHGEALARELRRRKIDVQYVAIPTGVASDQLWRQFDVLKESLRAAGEREVEKVVVDITHGLRSQPFFAGAVVTFVSMLDDKRPGFEVVYGAHDLIGSLGLDHAPVIRLTPFVQLVDWTHDLVLFLKSGRLGQLRERTERIGRDLRRAWFHSGGEGPEPYVREFAQQIERFARDLQTIRTGALLLGTDGPSSATALLKATQQVREQMSEAIPPLADVLDRIAEMADGLRFEGDHLAGEPGRKVLLALVDTYLRMGRYIEAITTLREARITAWSAPAAAAPGSPAFDEGERFFTEHHLWPRAAPHENLTIGNIRNDINHAGYRANPGDATDLIRNIRTQRDEYASSPAPSSPHGERIFLNVSNHPSHEWCDGQRRAALGLAGTIRDMPFPNVAPNWSTRRVEEEANNIVCRIPPETTHALVQGEFTLTAALVKRLQAKGVRCLAATTEREVERTADGAEVRRFRFVRFRDYPRLA